eukprot:538913-Amphidinium_carterae.1
MSITFEVGLADGINKSALRTQRISPSVVCGSQTLDLGKSRSDARLKYHSSKERADNTDSEVSWLRSCGQANASLLEDLESLELLRSSL